MNDHRENPPDRFGALVGWAHENLGDRLMVMLQSTAGPDSARAIRSTNSAIS